MGSMSAVVSSMASCATNTAGPRNACDRYTNHQDQSKSPETGDLVTFLVEPIDEGHHLRSRAAKDTLPKPDFLISSMTSTSVCTSAPLSLFTMTEIASVLPAFC